MEKRGLQINGVNKKVLNQIYFNLILIKQKGKGVIFRERYEVVSGCLLKNDNYLNIILYFFQYEVIVR